MTTHTHKILLAPCFAALLAASTPDAAASESPDSPAFSLGVTSFFSGRRYATADEAVDREPGYRRFRISSDRLSLLASARFVGKYTVWGSIGQSDVAIHASEGETLEYSGALAGELGVHAVLLESENGLWDVCAAATLLSVSGEDADVTRVHRNELPAGDTSLDWTETAILLEGRHTIGPVRFSAGIRLSAPAIEQDRTLSGRTYKSDFESEETVGMFLGADCRLTQRLSLSGLVRFLDESVFAAGLTLDI